VENIYTLKLVNMDERPHTYRLWISGLPEATLLSRQYEVAVDAGAVLELPVRVRIDPYELKKVSQEILFHLQALDQTDLAITQSGRFVGPSH